jgi:hypothetical protein
MVIAQRGPIVTIPSESLRSGKIADLDILITLRGSVGKFGLFRASEKYKTGFINAQLLIVRNHAYPDACQRGLRQAGALLGLVAIFNFVVLQRAEAVGLRIKLASKSHFSDYSDRVPIPHISDEKERRFAGSNFFLAGAHGGIGRKEGIVGELVTAFKSVSVFNCPFSGIFREWASTLLDGCNENRVSFNQIRLATANINNSESCRDRTIWGHQKKSFYLADYNFWASDCYESPLCCGSTIARGYKSSLQEQSLSNKNSQLTKQRQNRENTEKPSPPVRIGFFIGLASFVGSFVCGFFGVQRLNDKRNLFGASLVLGSFLLLILSLVLIATGRWMVL